MMTQPERQLFDSQYKSSNDFLRADACLPRARNGHCPPRAELSIRTGNDCPRRHRGKSPRQAAFFFRNPEVTFHAAQLPSLYLIYDLVGAGRAGLESRFHVGSLESGTLLCQAYEAYLELHAPVSISFEHAWFLLLALARHDEMGVARCEACGGLRLCDLLARHKQTCGNCHYKSPALKH